MKKYLLWTFKSFLLLTVVLGLVFLTDGGVKKGEWMFIIAYVIGASFFAGFVFWIFEVKYIPHRKVKLNKKVAKIFEAEILSETICRFKLGDFDVLTESAFHLGVLQAGNYLELVHFHIPRNQIDEIQNKLNFKLKKSEIRGLPTYDVYQTNGLGLKLAKRRLMKKIA